MGRCRIVQPATDRIPISDGDWIEVKRDLTYGERTHASAAVIGEVRADGWMRPNLDGSAAQIVAYLVDWSLVDMEDKRIPIRTDAEKLSAIKSLDEATVKEISDAIETHAKARDAELDAAKKLKAGTPESAAT